MELQDFIKQTLVEIMNGVKDAQEATKDSGGYVAPKTTDLLKAAEVGITPRQGVEFDVALTTSDAKGQKAGIGVFLGSFGVGGQNEAKAENLSHTRIRFSVPIALPTVVPDKPIGNPGFVEGKVGAR